MTTKPSRQHRSAGWAALIIGPLPRAVAALAAGLLALVLIAVVLNLTGQPPANLAQPALEHLPDAGVDNPVTAVLLNYRAFDTWLELGVLLLALMGTFTLLRTADLRRFPAHADPRDLLPRLAGLFVPLLVIAGGYLLWRGTHAPGGAFQAGALWAAAGVVARLAGVDRLHRLPGWALRLAYLAAFALFLAFGLATLAFGHAFLFFPPDHAATLIFLLELFATLSIAVTLWSLYIAAYPAD